MTRPSSSKSTLTAFILLTSVTLEASQMILVIISPPRPMTSLILAGLILNISVFGAYLDTSLRGSLICFAITSKISRRAFLACFRASFNIFSVTPLILISICKAHIPFFVPATLKSISPK